jgi:hypothetical protein
MGITFMGITFVPGKANAPLVIDTDTVLPFSISRQQFEPVAGSFSEVM